MGIDEIDEIGMRKSRDLDRFFNVLILEEKRARDLDRFSNH